MTSAKSASRNGGEDSFEVEESPTRQTRKRKMQQVNAKSKMTQSQYMIYETVYDKGTYVAYIDSYDSIEKFKIGLLLEDLRDVDIEVLIDVYNEIATFSYQKEAAKIPVFEYAIICDVNVTIEKGLNRGKPIVKITRQQVNKIKKHMDNTIKIIEEKQHDNDEEDEEDDEDDGQDYEEEEEEDKGNTGFKKDDMKTILSRKLVKPKVQQSQEAPSSSQSKKANSSMSRSVKSMKKEAKKKVTKISSKKDENDGKIAEEEEVQIEKEESVEVEMIDTTKKNGKGKKRESLIPKLGHKRKRVSQKKNLEESEEGSNVVYEEFEEGEDEQPMKKRKMADGKAKPEKQPKAKKPPKRPTEFKKGRWNPNIEIIDVDKYKESDSSQPYLDCCVRCNNKNIIRAAITGNEKLLKAGIAEKKKISSLAAFWSPEVKWTSLEYMASTNKHNLLEIMLHPKISHIPQYSSYEQERNIKIFSTRASDPEYLMNFADSDMVSHMGYDARARKVQMCNQNSL